MPFRIIGSKVDNPEDTSLELRDFVGSTFISPSISCSDSPGQDYGHVQAGRAPILGGKASVRFEQLQFDSFTCGSVDKVYSFTT